MLNRSNWIGVAALLAGMVIHAPGAFPLPPELERASETEKRQYIQFQSQLALQEKIRVGGQRYQQRQVVRQALVEGMRAKAVERRQTIYGPPAPAPIARSGKPRSPMPFLLAAALLVAVSLGWRHMRSGGWNESTWLTAGVLAIRNLPSELARYLNPHYNPWALSPATAVGFSEDVRAEEKALSEFVAEFRLGPRMAPLTPVSPNVPLVSTIPDGQDREIESRREEDPVAMFLSRAPELLAALRKLIRDIVGASDTAARQTMLGELCDQIRHLKGEAGIPQMLPAWQMACSLEGLLKQLTERMSNTTPSTLRTVASGVELLDQLCQQGVRPDLCTNPPFRLLVADDDPISRRAMSFALKRGLTEPSLVGNGDGALALASQQPYDLVFLDVQMPGMDGFELCSKIRHTIPNCSTPVVFVTCQSDFNARAQSVACGGDDLIGKPFLTFEITVKALTLALGARLANGRARLGSANQQSQTALLPKPGNAREVHNAAVAPEHGLAVSAERSGNSESTARPTAAHRLLTGVDRSPNPDLGQRDVPTCAKPGRNHVLDLYYTHGPASLKRLQSQFHAARHAPDAAVRQELFGELSAAALLFVGQTERAGLSSTQRLGSALEALLRKLNQRADYCTPTALDAVGGALDLLLQLCRSGVEPDLVAAPPRILVVDDDLIARRAFAGAIQVAFGRPDSAPDGEAALALAGEKPYDVIFLDVHMPGMDGCTTCEKIHQTPANRGTPILFVTGQNDLEARNHAARSGGCGFIPKPVLASEITLTALTYALRGRLNQPRFARTTDPAVLPGAEVNAN